MPPPTDRLPVPTAPPEGWSAYLHWPWCRSRCAYCAFNVRTSAPEEERWLAGIAAGWAASRPAFPGRATALYLGGGTPSLASASVVERVLQVIPTEPDAEITLEANPGTISREGLLLLREAGVNRLSLGVQTFAPQHARRLSRGHTVAAARALLALAGGLGFRSWSADLIFSLPDQTLAELEQDLETLLSFEPPHVSIYSLSYEPGTPLHRALSEGRIQPTDEELWAEQYALVVRTLEAAGLQRYEVSNFARPGHRAVHNEQVWRGAPYLGLGPGAHGFRPDGARTLGAAELSDWLDQPAGAVEHPAPAQAAVDHVLSTLRHVDGLSLPQLQARTGARLARAPLQILLDRELLRLVGPRGARSLVLGPAAWPVADAVVARVCGALRHDRALDPVQSPAGGGLP